MTFADPALPPPGCRQEPRTLQPPGRQPPGRQPDVPSARAWGRMSRSFGAAAEQYLRFRPGYPDEAIRLAVGSAPSESAPTGSAPTAPVTVLDLGAGTGKLTAALLRRGLRVIAVEPDPLMLAALPAAAAGAAALVGTAERIPLADASVDVVTAGQAMHWFQLDLALPEIARVLRPGGRLAPMWNVDDIGHRFTASFQQVLNEHVRPAGGMTGRRMTGRSRAAPDPPFRCRREFTDPVLHTFSWRRTMTPEQLHGLIDTLSYVLTAPGAARRAVHAGLRTLVSRCNGPLELAEVCQVWVARRR